MSSLDPSRDVPARQRRALLGTALLSLLASLGFVLAPVDRTEAVYSWPGPAGNASAVAIPLMTERPAELTASGSCADVRNAGPGTVLVSTTPLEDQPGTAPLQGLRIEVADDGGLGITTAGTDLDEQDVGGDCRWQLHSTATATTLTVDGDTVQQLAGDHRPAVAGVFSQLDGAGDISVDVTADTVFQTSPSLLKTFLAVVAVLALLASLVLLVRGERSRGAPERGDPPPRATRGPLRWLVDIAVVGVLVVWTLVGTLTVDDGYIAGIIRSRDANGYVGNVHRWWNAPEAPFGWFYEVLDGWSHISSTTTWMRVPALLLGVATWFLVSRGLLPRLGAPARTPGGLVIAALAFGVWWLPTNVGLRPEAWVAAGFAAVLVLVERGLRRERLLPLMVGMVVAGATLGVTPTGAIAFLPYLAAAVPILRLLRRTVGLPLGAVLVVAAAASALLLMFADQSLGAVMRANDIRAALPGSVPWSSEVDRWDQLLSAGEMQGALGRRVPVLLTVAAVVAITWRLVARRWPEDATRAVATRFVATFGLGMVLLLFTPTKWTMHFGAFAPLGTALVVLACGLYTRGRGTDDAPDDAATARMEPAAGRIRATALTDATAGLVTVFLLAAWAFAGWNQWPFISNDAVTWRDIPPELFGITFSAVFLTAAAVTAVVGTVLVLAARVREDDVVRLPGGRRWLPAVALVTAAVCALTLVIEVGGFLKASYALRDTYSLASDARATVDGRPCGLAGDLTVETDPLAGVLPASPATTAENTGDPAESGTTGDGDGGPEVLDGFVAVTGAATPVVGQDLLAAGTALPGWAATGHSSADGTGTARLVTGWFELPDSFGTDGRPLVVTTAGDRQGETNLVAEFGTVDGDRVTPVGARGLPDPGMGPGARDARLDAATAPAGADVVRLIGTDRGADTDLPLAVSVPRVPVTTPFLNVVDADSPAIVDWPVAFVFPCQRQAVQHAGITDVPEWRIASASDAGDIIVTEFVGGPYTAAGTLVDQVEVPVYQEARPLERPIRLLRWEPRVEVGEPATDISRRSVSALAD